MSDKNMLIVEKKEEFEDLKELAKGYNDTIKDSKDNLISTDEMLKGILKTLQTNFEEVSKSDRTKHRYSTLYAESISKIATVRNNIRKDLANIGEKKLNNNLKVRALYELTVKSEDGKQELDLVEFHNSLGSMFNVN